MKESDWIAFSALPAPALHRFTRMFEQFCARGEENLPKACVRWLTPAASAGGKRNTGAFEAYGVIIQGRRVAQGSPGTFYVTDIISDGFKPPAPRPRPPRSDDRQAPLPFTR